MADSGYESFNTFAPLVRKRMYFVIRMKDINSNGILSSYDLPDSEFDTHIRTTLTRRHTKETLGIPTENQRRKHVGRYLRTHYPLQ